jgi:hypothetical protein
MWAQLHHVGLRTIVICELVTLISYNSESVRSSTISFLMDCEVIECECIPEKQGGKPGGYQTQESFKKAFKKDRTHGSQNTYVVGGFRLEGVSCTEYQRGSF